MVNIPSDSFFFEKYIHEKIVLNTITADEVSYGIKARVEEVLQHQFSLLTEETNQWFYLAKLLAKTDGDIAYKLATIYYIEQNNTEAIYWYKQAILLKHQKAPLALIDLYIENKELIHAKKLLIPLKHDDVALNKLIDVSISLGDIALLDTLIPLVKYPDSLLLGDIKKYKITNIQNSSATDNNTCENSIQLFASNLPNLQKLDALIKQVKQYPINAYFCFNTPVYISSKKLACRYASNEAIRCDESTWENILPEIKTRFIGLMLNKGGANVDHGIMYLDALDDKNVFIHELSHLLGFVDEYALPKAHKICQKPQDASFSHNIVILNPEYTGTKADVLLLLKKQIPWYNLIDKDTPIIERVNNKWKIGTPSYFQFNHKKKVGLFKADTCNKNALQAFKPSNIKTNLRYYEEPFIDLYIELLQKKPYQFSMPSYHYNIAKYLFENSQEKQGTQWLNKALKIEGMRKYSQLNYTDRYHKIKSGKF